MITKALSIRAPWWVFILHAGKDIENRDWSTKFRGRIWVHASKWWSLEGFREDWESGVRCYREAGGEPREELITPRWVRDTGGHIVGSVDIVDCVSASKSPWFFGEHGFVLANPRSLKVPILCRGALGLFNVPDDVLSKLEVVA